ncbi:MAG: hypothetical protein U0166_05435 [Acidobacteriota bacterium]
MSAWVDMLAAARTWVLRSGWVVQPSDDAVVKSVSAASAQSGPIPRSLGIEKTIATSSP